MHNLDKIKRQLSKPVTVIISNDGQEDEFEFKRLNVEQQAIMMELGKRFESREMITIDGQEVPDVSKEDMIEMEKLLLDVVSCSMPEIDMDILKDFVNDNFNQLTAVLVKLMPQQQAKEGMKLINERKEALNAKE